MSKLTLEYKKNIQSYFKDDILASESFPLSQIALADEDFHYVIFKDLISSATGLFRNIDERIITDELELSFEKLNKIYEKYANFKTRSKHSLSLYENTFLKYQEIYMEKLELLEHQENEYEEYNKQEDILYKKINAPVAEDNIKLLRSRHADVLDKRDKLERSIKILRDEVDNFYEKHKAGFLSVFDDMKFSIEHKFFQILDTFAYEYNQELFSRAKSSNLVENFLLRSGIRGELNICKFLEYYSKNIIANIVVDEALKMRLEGAKKYCASHCNDEMIILQEQKRPSPKKFLIQAKLRLFLDINEKILDDVVSNAIFKKYKMSEFIAIEGTTHSNMIFLVSGSVMLYNHTLEKNIFDNEFIMIYQPVFNTALPYSAKVTSNEALCINFSVNIEKFTHHTREIFYKNLARELLKNDYVWEY